ncbi:MAG: hypothetical protein IJT64_00765 [Kiritimatiellae bacterium]|nr:hypothetical protein [Kiritimatiellia bacterium]
MKVQPPSSYSLSASERLRRALFAMVAGAAVTAAGQSPAPATKADTAEADPKALVPRTIDFGDERIPMTPMLIVPDMKDLQEMTPRPLATFSPEELARLREKFLAQKAKIALSSDQYSAVSNAVRTATSNAAAIAATTTNAVSTAKDAVGQQATDTEAGKP